VTALATRPKEENKPEPPTSGGRVLNGPEKGLLFLVSLDERVATQIMSHLDKNELAELRAASDKLTEVDARAITGVHREFVERVKEGVPASLKGSSAYLRRLAGKVMGEGKAAEIWDNKPVPEGPVAALAELDVQTVLAILEKEKLQTLAVIFSLFEAGKAAELLSKMPAQKQADIVGRMSQLNAVPESVIQDIEEQFAAELASLGQDQRRPLKGVEAAARLVKRLDAEVSENLMEQLGELDEAVAEELKKKLFTFEDLLRIDGRGMQVLLKEVATDQLVVSLKSASDDLKEKVFASLSSRAGALLKEELELLGPVRVSEVEEAQAAVCAVALKLKQEGRITVASEGGGDYV
jgi:flagellar motor switch protein FliG